MGDADSASPVMHVFRLGPVPGPGGVRGYVYVGQVEGGEPSVQRAPSDKRGLEAVKNAAGGAKVSCEPALASAAGSLGLATGPLPASVLKTRAVFAFAVGCNKPLGKAMLGAIGAFLKGAAAYWNAHSWDVVGPDEPLRVLFPEGHTEPDGELTVVGGDGMRLPGAALCDARDALQELAPLEGEDWIEAVVTLANLTVDMEREPAWVADILEEGYGLPRVPTAARKRGGSVVSVLSQDLLVAAAVLEAIAAWAALNDRGAVGEGVSEAGGTRVKARLCRKDQPQAVQKLTPAPVPEEPKPEEPKPEPEVEQRPSPPVTGPVAEATPPATPVAEEEKAISAPTPAGGGRLGATEASHLEASAGLARQGLHEGAVRSAYACATGVASARGGGRSGTSSARPRPCDAGLDWGASRSDGSWFRRHRRSRRAADGDDPSGERSSSAQSGPAAGWNRPIADSHAGCSRATEARCAWWRRVAGGRSREDGCPLGFGRGCEAGCR
ncbi:MAG: hypothetical protein QM765_52890 [Myxococcales bacterium]